MGMEAILFIGAEPFEQNDKKKKILRQKVHVKSGENWSNCFKEEDVSRLHDFMHVYSPGARAVNHGRQKFNCY